MGSRYRFFHRLDERIRVALHHVLGFHILRPGLCQPRKPLPSRVLADAMASLPDLRDFLSGLHLHHDIFAEVDPTCRDSFLRCIFAWICGIPQHCTRCERDEAARKDHIHRLGQFNRVE